MKLTFLVGLEREYEVTHRLDDSGIKYAVDFDEDGRMTRYIIEGNLPEISEAIKDMRFEPFYCRHCSRMRY